MRATSRRTAWGAALVLAGLAIFAMPAVAGAHCDTLDGPVVGAARAALAAGDITPVLQWVQPDHEAALRTAFQRTLAVRVASPAARELADEYFFETLVRLHREGEGFPYTGLQPAGAPIAPAIRAADAALASGDADALVEQLTAAVAAGVRERFAAARAAQAHAGHNVAAGRHFVATYVALTHYVEALAATAEGHAAHAEPAPAGAPAPHAHP